jgi:hypothetical protein
MIRHRIDWTLHNANSVLFTAGDLKKSIPLVAQAHFEAGIHATDGQPGIAATAIEMPERHAALLGRIPLCRSGLNDFWIDATLLN